MYMDTLVCLSVFVKCEDVFVGSCGALAVCLTLSGEARAGQLRSGRRVRGLCQSLGRRAECLPLLALSLGAAVG